MSTVTPRISVQLYSLRTEAAADFPRALRGLGEVGFAGVELAGFHNLTPVEFSSVATGAGLVVSSGHIGDVTPDALNASLDDLQTVGCDIAVLAYLPPESFADRDAVSRSAEALNAANEIARGRGMSIGYHNHWWEFQTQIDDQSAWSIFFEQLEPSVFAELDIYWATVGGVVPQQVIADLGDRLRLLHVKDGPADAPENPMVAAGSGSIDIAGILGAAPTAEWHVVELDQCATDMFTAVADSYRYLVGAGLSQGRA
jgi:sugar phosphate isomerase/epimerase